VVNKKISKRRRIKMEKMISVNGVKMTVRECYSQTHQEQDVE